MNIHNILVRHPGPSLAEDSCMAADPGDFFELKSTQTSIAMEESELSEQEPLGPLQVLY